MKKSFVLLLVVFLSFCLLTACKASNERLNTDKTLLPKEHFGNRIVIQESRKLVYQFVKSNLLSEFGVNTNLIDTDQETEVASGHEVLSESSGLLMRYLAIMGEKQIFEEVWVNAKKYLDLKSGFSYRYSPLLQKRYPLNAAVDDLRIIRALYEAGNVFKEPQLTKEAKTYGNRFYQNNVKNSQLYDFYDETTKGTNDFITLCYIDLKTLNLLPQSTKNRERLTNNMSIIVKNGYLTDLFPFYETRFKYGTHSYASENINTVESLLTILALSEVGQQNPQSITYLKDKVKTGALYGQYTREGKPTNDIQSTAIYAITAMIGSQIGDISLYEDSIKRVNEFQIKDSQSPLYGGFGDTISQQVYSFDNLTALLAYAY